MMKRSVVMKSLSGQREQVVKRTINPKSIAEPSLERMNIGEESYAISEWGMRTLLKKFKIPYAFYDRLNSGLRREVWEYGVKLMKDEIPELQMVYTTQGNVIKGFVEPDYPDIPVESMLNTIPGNWDFLHQAHDVLEPVVRFRMIDKSCEVDEKTWLGLDILMSEVGGTPFIIENLLYRETCDNGLMSARRLPSGYASYVELAYSAMGRELLAAVIGKLPEVLFNVDRVKQTMMKIEGAKETSADTLDYLERMGEKYASQKYIVKKLNIAVEEEPTNNRWELAQTVSHLAVGIPYKRGKVFEFEAGRLLNLTVEGAAY